LETAEDGHFLAASRVHEAVARNLLQFSGDFGKIKSPQRDFPNGFPFSEYKKPAPGGFFDV
jgi:hypothetical protein